MGKRRHPKTNAVLAGDIVPDEVLEQIESEPGFISMMKQSDRDMKAGRWVDNQTALRKLRADPHVERRVISRRVERP